MSTITATIDLNALLVTTKDVVGTGTTSRVSLPFAFSLATTAGTGANQADIAYFKRRTVPSAGSADSIDLAGSLLDVFGDAVVFAEVAGIFIKNNSVTIGETLLVGGGSNAFINWIAATGDIVKVAPGGVFALYNPLADAYGVTASTGDLLKIDVAAGTSVSYDILIVGKSA